MRTNWLRYTLAQRKPEPEQSPWWPLFEALAWAAVILFFAGLYWPWGKS
jgi:hypothetical protein